MAKVTGNKILTGSELKPVRTRKGLNIVDGMTRRDFIKYTGSAIASVSFGSWITGCREGDNPGGSGTSTSNTNFPALVFSDVHFNPFDDPSLFPALFAADTSQWVGIFESSSMTAPSVWGADTNYPLLALALASIKQNLGASRLVIYTGDILGHYFQQLFYQYYYESQGLIPAPTTQSAADTAAMIAFTDKTVAFFMDRVRAAIGNISVMFALGNSDSYTVYGPDSTFLANTAPLYFSKFLNGTADEHEFLSTFTSGGYYSAEPLGTNLMVIGLNTIVFSPIVPGDNDSLVSAELDWLDSRLALAAADGKKVWLLMHVPPGADIATSAKPANVSSSGQISAATMMWYPAYQARFLRIVAKYPGVVSLTLAGHTHMDEYRIISSSDVLEITPAISPVFGGNPAYKVFTFSQETFEPNDYSSINYDLAALPVQFNAYYTFSNAYAMHGFLGDSLLQLTPELVTDDAKQALYRGYYFSGHNSPVDIADIYSNSITNLNWPIYWSGIGHMDQQSLIDSVNSYR